MKLNKLKQYIVTYTFAALALVACNVPDNNDELISFEPEEVENPVTISQLIIANPNLTILERALRTIENEASDNDDIRIVTELNVPGNSTVFAPSDEALQAFLDANGVDDIADLPLETLTNLILNHVVVGELKAADLTTGYVTTRATKTNRINREDIVNNISIYINTSEGVTINRDVTVTTPDIDANNGVIHIVDGVINLSSIANLIGVNPSLSSFIASVRHADTFVDEEGNSFGLERFLRRQENLTTTFVPVNAAFTAYLNTIDPSGETTLVDLDPQEVGRIIKSHIVGGLFESENIINQQLILTNTQGEDLAVDGVNLTITDIRGRVSNINADIIDVHGTNGVLHLIDNVILPSDPPAADM